jgi:hypothetical protein
MNYHAIYAFSFIIYLILTVIAGRSAGLFTTLS